MIARVPGKAHHRVRCLPRTRSLGRNVLDQVLRLAGRWTEGGEVILQIVGCCTVVVVVVGRKGCMGYARVGCEGGGGGGDQRSCAREVGAGVEAGLRTFLLLLICFWVISCVCLRARFVASRELEGDGGEGAAGSLSSRPSSSRVCAGLRR